MIITYAKPILISNIISLTNKKIDTITVGSKLEASNYYITEENSSWIEKTLIIADYQVRRVLHHLLKTELTNQDKSTLIYNVVLSHSLQEIIIPQLIEEALIDYVSQTWMTEKTLMPQSTAITTFTELRSVSLMSEKPIHRTYHIF